MDLGVVLPDADLEVVLPDADLEDVLPSQNAAFQTEHHVSAFPDAKAVDGLQTEANAPQPLLYEALRESEPDCLAAGLYCGTPVSPHLVLKFL
ncbi:hypothetical protein JCM15765_32950 [Paradesulfitobacterium aromaticivorans]